MTGSDGQKGRLTKMTATFKKKNDFVSRFTVPCLLVCSTSAGAKNHGQKRGINKRGHEKGKKDLRVLRITMLNFNYSIQSYRLLLYLVSLLGAIREENFVVSFAPIYRILAIRCIHDKRFGHTKLHLCI